MTPLSHCLFFLPTNYQIYIERVCCQFHHCYLPWAALVPTACGTSTWVTLILKCRGFCIFLLGCYLFLLHFCHYHSWNSGRCSAQGEQSKCASMMRQREQSLLLCHLPVHQEIFFSALPGISSDFISETVNELNPSNQPSSSPAPLYSFGTSDQGKVPVKTNGVQIKHPATMSVRFENDFDVVLICVITSDNNHTNTRGEHSWSSEQKVPWKS